MDNSSISLAVVGDIMLGDFPLTLGFGVRSTIESGINVFENVHNLLRKKDICFGNLECVLSDYGIDKTNIESIQMRGSPKSISLLKDANFNVLSISNNHIMQHGVSAFQETKMLLEQANIMPVGVSNGTSGECIPQVFDKYGMKVCFLGYSQRPEKYAKNILYPYGRQDVIIKQIKECLDISDVIVVSLHWGDEFIDRPSIDQVLEAHAYIDAGASLVLGHHPHILQGIERYKNGLISYSLGNFVFDFWQKELRQSIILCINFKGKRIENVDVIPIFISRNYMPTPLEGKAARILLNKLSRLYIPNENDIKNTKQMIMTYTRGVRRLELINKIDNRIFFLRNIHRYGFLIIYQSIQSFIQKRMQRR